MSRTQQQVIAGLMDRLDPMVESPSMTGMSTLMGGGSAATRDDSTLADVESTTVIMAEPSCDEEEDEEGFTATQLRIAKRFIELMGGADKARAAVDKVDEGEEFLGLIDDDEQIRGDSDASAISKMAGMIPGLPDLPMELSNLYNPAAGGPSM